MMIGIWYFDPVATKWLLFETVSQVGCESRIAELRGVGFVYTSFKLARRRPTASPK